MRRTRDVRKIALIALAGLGGSGCTQHHYYGAGVPLCAEPAVGGEDVICEVPPGGTLVTTAPARPAVVLGQPRQPRVVISEPRSGPLVARGGPRAWRRSEPEGLATRVEGALEDETQTR